MQAFPKIESSEYTDLNKVIRWFITLRWIAAMGVSAVLLIVYFLYHYKLPYLILLLITVLIFLSNLAFTIYYSSFKHRNLSRNEMGAFLNIQVSVDYILLLLLIYFTGFLENPFLYYFVFHIMLTSFIFSRRVVYLYVGVLLSIFAALSVAEYLQIIPHFSLYEQPSSFSDYYSLIFLRVVGLCSTLCITAYLITSIKSRIEERGKRVEVELDRYKSLDKTKSNFILQVTHELRGPLAALKGYHEMILKGITGEVGVQTRDTLLKANRRTANLLTIIDEMIDYAFMKSEEELQYSKTEINLRSVINDNIEAYSHRAKEKGIEIVSSCSKDLSILANRDLLNIILGNLITNAIKYSPEKRTITIHAMEDDNRIHLLVKDEGIGIEPEELENIFEEFYRTRRARIIEKDGTGLGLSIVKKAVDSLRGKIVVYSELDKGTSFHIYLPINSI
ncbi:MAG: HAMP domain-containing sensor histidine kinase [Spirochaetota bacterium]